MTFRVTFLACLTLVMATSLPGGLRAQGKKEPLPPDLDRVPRDAMFVLSVRMADLWKNDTLKPFRDGLTRDAPDTLAELEKALATPFPEVERFTAVTFLDGQVGQGRPRSVVILNRSRPYEQDKFLAALGADNRQKVGGETVYSANPNSAYWLISDTAYAMGPLEDLDRFVRMKVEAEGPLATTLDTAAEKHHLVVGINVEMLSALLSTPGAPAVPNSLQPLLKARAFTGTGSLTREGVKATAWFSFAEAADAKAARAAAKDGVEQIRSLLPAVIDEVSKAAGGFKVMVDLLKKVDGSLKESVITVKGTDLELTADLKAEPKALAADLAVLAKEVHVAALRMQSSNNLHQIGIAMHTYHDATNTFPAAAIHSNNGKPLLSWRVAILPSLGEEKLYKEFKLDEPWDSEHNKKLLAKMPRVFAAPGAKAGSTETPYQAITGAGTVFDGPKGKPLLQITDGTSNTVMCVEAPGTVPWTKPEDIVFDNGKILPRLLAAKADSFLVLLGDGSVRSVRKTVSEETLRGAITAAGGEVLGNDW